MTSGASVSAISIVTSVRVEADALPAASSKKPASTSSVSFDPPNPVSPSRVDFPCLERTIVRISFPEVSSLSVADLTYEVLSDANLKLLLSLPLIAQESLVKSKSVLISTSLCRPNVSAELMERIKLEVPSSAIV